MRRNDFAERCPYLLKSLSRYFPNFCPIAIAQSPRRPAARRPRPFLDHPIHRSTRYSTPLPATRCPSRRSSPEGDPDPRGRLRSIASPAWRSGVSRRPRHCSRVHSSPITSMASRKCWPAIPLRLLGRSRCQPQAPGRSPRCAQSEVSTRHRFLKTTERLKVRGCPRAKYEDSRSPRCLGASHPATRHPPIRGRTRQLSPAFADSPPRTRL